MKHVWSLVLVFLSTAALGQAEPKFNFFRCECTPVGRDFRPEGGGRLYTNIAGGPWFCRWAYHEGDQDMIAGNPSMGREPVRRDPHGDIALACYPEIATPENASYPDFFAWEGRGAPRASKEPYPSFASR